MSFFIWFSMGISFAEHPEQLVLATVTGSLNAPLAQLVEQLTLNLCFFICKKMKRNCMQKVSYRRIQAVALYFNSGFYHA